VNQIDTLFVQLLYTFHQSAMIAMGKLKNPMTDAIERNMEQAKQAIDLVDMLKEKTKNNLSADLTKVLDGLLTELRLNYVDETNKETVKS
jgi:hypothetical protein